MEASLMSTINGAAVHLAGVPKHLILAAILILTLTGPALDGCRV
jgi:hypothetical protein